jgi:phospholipid transport system substrate-binding protein
MNPIRLLWGVIFLFLALGIANPVWAEDPIDQIRQTTNRIMSILTDPALKEPARAEERRKRIREAADERFDWEEMARRSLAQYWARRTEGERREFTSLFSDLLEKKYMDTVEGFSGEKFLYKGEKVEGDYGVDRVKIVTPEDVEISVEYRVRRKGDDWFIYDVSIEGVSLVNNYRTELSRLLLKSSYEELVEKLKAKLTGKESDFSSRKD